jgi:hypothetical protein
VIDLSQNDLEGDVEIMFGDDLAATGLTTVILNNNGLRGTFLAAVSSFLSLTTLQLHGNAMNGEVPETVCEAQGLSTTFLTTLMADRVELFCACCSYHLFLNVATFYAMCFLVVRRKHIFDG